MSGERTYYELESYPKQGEWSLPGIYSSSRTLGKGQLVVIHDGDDFQLATVRRTVGQLEALTNAGRMGAQPIVDLVDTAAWQAGREAAIKRQRIRQLMDAITDPGLFERNSQRIRTALTDGQAKSILDEPLTRLHAYVNETPGGKEATLPARDCATIIAALDVSRPSR